MQLSRYQRPITSNDRKAGTVLVLFAVLVFAVLGIAALTVDLGFAALGQAQMQAAADTAALEGVRLRDYDAYRFRSNLYRRPLVAEIARLTMDDDLHPTRGVEASDPFHPELPPDDPDALRLGAGASFRLTDGIGAANASALIVVPDASSTNAGDQWLDDPMLQTNARNAPGGDIVSGRFVSFASHAENEFYERDDFDPALPVGFDTSGGFNAIGMLVRLRRTTGANPLDENEGISSRGPSQPFLFGLGTSIHAASSGYNPRTDGLTLRAVAIASARPALRIGPPPLMPDGTIVLNRRDEPMFGVGYWHTNPSGARQWFSIGFSFPEFWEPFVGTTTCEFDTGSTGLSWDLTNDAGGGIRLSDGTLIGQLMREGGTIGDFVPDDLTTGPGAMSPGAVAQVFAEIRALSTSPTQLLYAYFPVYDTITSPTGSPSQRVIGFGFGALSFPTANTLRFTFDFDTRDDNQARILVAPDNASANLGHRTLPSSLGAEERTQLFASVVQFTYPAGVLSGRWQDVRVGSVLAAALVR